MSFTSDVFSIERDGHVATLWLDRPEKRNAMAASFWHDLPYAMAELGDDPDVRAVVLAAKGKSFCVGLDLTALAGAGIGLQRAKPASQAEANLQQVRTTRSFQAANTSKSTMATRSSQKTNQTPWRNTSTTSSANALAPGRMTKTHCQNLRPERPTRKRRFRCCA